MGTRSLTAVREGKDEIMLLYRQMDGYPTGHGQDLKDFLAGFRICNGIGSEQSKDKWANGMGCLAAQIVAHFKKEIGGFYLYKPGTRDCWEEYVYTISKSNDNRINLKVCEAGESGRDGKVLYDGLVDDYNPVDQ